MLLYLLTVHASEKSHDGGSLTLGSFIGHTLCLINKNKSSAVAEMGDRLTTIDNRLTTIHQRSRNIGIRRTVTCNGNGSPMNKQRVGAGDLLCVDIRLRWLRTVLRAHYR